MRAHAFQRVEHAALRPRAQGGITVERRRDRAAGDRPNDQTAAGSRIAEIKRRRRLGKSRHADPVDTPLALSDPLDSRAEGPHRAARVDYVLALEEAADPRLTHGQRPKNEGAMRNRLVARHANAAPKGAGAAAGERDLAVHGFPGPFRVPVLAWACW